jgi:hypothetical protein
MTDVQGKQRPKRIQRKRTKGWKMPDGAIYVGRPSKWGNPFPICRELNRESALFLFRCLIANGPIWKMTNRQKFFWPRGKDYPSIGAVKGELRGKDLACWCSLFDKDGNRVPCHADVLLEIANG